MAIPKTVNNENFKNEKQKIVQSSMKNSIAQKLISL